ncbi:MAG: hypothetical protein ACP5U1_15510, partial [Desulfomonilaceae bacterium]
EMESLIENMEQIAGSYELLDHVAFDLIKRSKIRVIFIDGKDPDNVYSQQPPGSDLTQVQPGGFGLTAHLDLYR